MFAKFVENFFQLECGQNGFDQHRALDGAMRQADFVLCHDENVVPQTGFEVALHFRQIEEGARAARDLFLGVVEQEQGEIEDAARHALVVDQHMLFVEMPAAWPHLQGGDLVVELVFLAGLVLEGQLATDGLVEVDLALDQVVPLRAVGILEVAHVRIGARVVGVDDHLGLDRTGDLGVAAFQGFRQRRDLPVTFADVLGFGQEVGHFTGIDARLAHDAGLEQFLAAWLEGAMQFGDQRHRFGRKNLRVVDGDGGVDLNAGGQAHEGLLDVGCGNA
ncbi:MAG: hypothetical protein FD157_2026 [Rhodocyclaceae bacterium]|nr:MAG: hypothetical protein FD157_2026 [Rhodocyclaceae bacterium]